MSTTRRPVRRPPRRVFWVRRILVLIVLAALVWGSIVLVRWLTSDDEPVPAPASSSASPSVADSPAASTTVTVPTSSTACAPESVWIRPTVPGRQSEREEVTIHFGVLLMGTEPCTLTLEPDDVLAVIQRDGSPVWDAAVCRTAVLTEPVTLSPGWITSIEGSWSGRTSGARCADDESWAPAGRYTLRIATLGGEPGTTNFTLEPKPENDDSEGSGEDEEGQADDGEDSAEVDEERSAGD